MLIVASTNAAYGRVHDHTTAIQRVIVHNAASTLPIVNINRHGPDGKPADHGDTVSRMETKTKDPRLAGEHEAGTSNQRASVHTHQLS